MTATWVALIARSRIISNRQYIPCSLYQTCLVHDSTLIQVDSTTFVGDMHLEELIWFSKVLALPFAHELCFDRVNYGLVRATAEGIINILYDLNDHVGALLLVEEDACFGLQALEPEFFEGLIECVPPS